MTMRLLHTGDRRSRTSPGTTAPVRAWTLRTQKINIVALGRYTNNFAGAPLNDRTAVHRLFELFYNFASELPSHAGHCPPGANARKRRPYSSQVALTTVMLWSRNPSLMSRSNWSRSASARTGMIRSASTSISTRVSATRRFASAIFHPSSNGWWPFSLAAAGVEQAPELTDSGAITRRQPVSVAGGFGSSA